MAEFDPRNPILVPLAEVVHCVADGWLAQFRGQAWCSGVIRRATGGVHSHSGMLRRENGAVDVLEMRMFRGGRAKPLEALARQYPARIDVFAPNPHGRWGLQYDAGGAVRYMRGLTGAEYGYRAVAMLGLRKIPGLWRLWSTGTLDVERRYVRPFCSHAVSMAYRIGGHVDPVPNCPDYMVSPNMLTRSLFFQYQFTVAEV